MRGAVASSSLLSIGLASPHAELPVVNVIVLPMAFLCGSFGPTRHYPRALRAVGDVLPLKYLVNSMNAIYLHGRQIWDRPGSVAVLAAWGFAGLLVAVRRFRWEPREG